MVVDLISFTEEKHPALTDALSHLAAAAKTISKNVSRAGIDLLGMTGETNVQGEEVKKLDIFSDKILINKLKESITVAGYCSEENDGILDYEKPGDAARYLVCTDPLDGSSNIDVNVSIGTIFSILERKTSKNNLTEDDFLQSGTKQLASGYFLYGSGTMLVYTAGSEVNGFTFDSEKDKFILSHPQITTPDKGAVYSTNEAYTKQWTQEMKDYIELLKTGNGGKDIPKHKARYIGSLVADFHRNLLYGGIYLYPGDRKNPEGKLRLLYECNPMAYVVKAAGGSATNGESEILEVQPRELHQRTPLFIGSSRDMELLMSMLRSEDKR